MDDKLRNYQKKRDFGATPEPSGAIAPAPEGVYRFVMQKHAARRLHYDLRLEMEGVLRSWAVPRGPSLDPSEKRLAVNTEDHPLEYLEFEGVIPEGSYGAGKMIVWDRGTYRCVGSQKDPVASWKRGLIDLQLEGEKLKGLWVLVRTSRGEENQWLLLKKKDTHADSTRNLTEEMPESVLSGLEVEELIGGETSSWTTRLNRLLSELQIERSAIDGQVAPMLATLVEKVPEGGHWGYELKYDGIRAMAEKKTGISGFIPAT